MKLTFLVCLLVAGAYGYNRETFKGRLNPRGTQTVENLMRDMIRRVNDLIKQNVKVNNMQLGPIRVDSFRVTNLDTHNINVIMDSNRLGVKVNNARVHLKAHLSAEVGVWPFVVRVGGQFDTYGDNINAKIDSGVGVRSGRLYSNGMGCNLHVGNPRVDLHLPIINHLANMVVRGIMPHVTGGVCEGIKKYGVGMVNGVFQTIPTNINVFNAFRLEFPIHNFRSWSRHLVAGVGMEVRPINNKGVSYSDIRLIALPEAEDGHMACATVSDFVLNTASRTFIPVGRTFKVDVGSILSLFFKTIFTKTMFVQGTIVQSPKILAEPKEIILNVKASGRLLDHEGKVIPNTETKPIELRVSAPNNQTPMFKTVTVEVRGPITLKVTVDLAGIIDYIVKNIDTLYKTKGNIGLVKRASGGDMTRVLNEMFFSKYFAGFSLKLSARHGSLVACVSGQPNSNAKNIVYHRLRQSFYG